jgi:hypothetical protein
MVNTIGRKNMASYSKKKLTIAGKETPKPARHLSKK